MNVINRLNEMKTGAHFQVALICWIIAIVFGSFAIVVIREVLHHISSQYTFTIVDGISLLLGIFGFLWTILDAIVSDSETRAINHKFDNHDVS